MRDEDGRSFYIGQRLFFLLRKMPYHALADIEKVMAALAEKFVVYLLEMAVDAFQRLGKGVFGVDQVFGNAARDLLRKQRIFKDEPVRLDKFSVLFTQHQQHFGFGGVQVGQRHLDRVTKPLHLYLHAVGRDGAFFHHKVVILENIDLAYRYAGACRYSFYDYHVIALYRARGL